MKCKGIVKNSAKIVLVSLIFFFILRVLYHNWDQLSEYKVSVNYYLLILSILVLIGSYFILNVTWYLLTAKMRIHIDFRGSTRNWFYSQLWKYLPGKLGMLLSRAYLYQKEGISIKRVSFAVILEAVMLLVAASMVFMLSFLFVNRLRGESVLSGNVVFIVSGIAVAGAGVFLQPAVFQGIINFLLKLMKKEQIAVEWSYWDSITILCCYVCDWLVLGVAFYLFVNSFTPIPISNVFFITGSFAFASIVSFISLFAPAGIGVREGILVIFLSRIMPESIAVILSIASRLWVVATEIAAVLIVKGIEGVLNSERGKPE